MSVFGGDSWGREAQYRKRRIDEVVVEGIDGSSYKKLSSGKYACLVCHRNPIFDTPLMLSMHCRGSRHLAVESKVKEKELMRRAEIHRRLTLRDSHASSVESSTTKQSAHLASKPLFQIARKAASEILSNKKPEHNLRNENHDMVLKQNDVKSATPDFFQNHSCPANVMSDKLVQQELDFRERRERELEFTSAGWKRDCHGKWYKDENVEFDSDEEDPTHFDRRFTRNPSENWCFDIRNLIAISSVPLLADPEYKIERLLCYKILENL